ncbi:hypothetical protein CANTEDRAFT_134298, partial [Yamadazyma tenuis ATCC 10573]
MFKKMDIPITAEKVRTSGQRLTGDCGPLKRSADKEGMAGAIFHGVGEGRICFMEAAAIAKRKDLEVKPLTKEEVFEVAGPWFGMIIVVDNHVSNKFTIETLGWKPIGPISIMHITKNHWKG